MSDSKKKGLGRGLASLFGDAKTGTKEISNFKDKQKMTAISDLNRNRYQPRLKFDEEKLNELSNSQNIENCKKLMLFVLQKSPTSLHLHPYYSLSIIL